MRTGVKMDQDGARWRRYASKMRTTVDSTCARARPLARQAFEAFSSVRRYVSSRRQHKEYAANDGSSVCLDAAQTARRRSDAEDGVPGSGDEDVLNSLSVVGRLQWALRKEKRAHARIKRQLDAAYKRSERLQQSAAVRSNSEAVEHACMHMEDVYVSVALLKDQFETATTPHAIALGADIQRVLVKNAPGCEEGTRRELVERTKDEIRLEVLKELHEALGGERGDVNSGICPWKARYQKALDEIAEMEQKNAQLVEQLRMVQKTAVMVVNRQFLYGGVATRSERRCSNASRENRSLDYVNVGQGPAAI